MDQMEMEKLVLVMPTGFIWSNPRPERGNKSRMPRKRCVP